MSELVKTMTAEEVVETALGNVWRNTESQARRVAEYASAEITRLTGELSASQARVKALEEALRPSHRAASDVFAERERQQSAEGWTEAHDDEHETGELATAARAYAYHATNYAGHSDVGYRMQEPPSYWPWNQAWWKPRNRRRDLVKAAALILAEIERLDRQAARAMEGK